MTNYTFQQFLLDQINEKTDGSQRAFANLLGVANSTVSRMLDPRNPTKPELQTLMALSRVSNTSLITLVRLAYPESVEASTSATAQLVADEFDKLPDAIQTAIITLMRGAKARGSD